MSAANYECNCMDYLSETCGADYGSFDDIAELAHVGARQEPKEIDDNLHSEGGRVQVWHDHKWVYAVHLDSPADWPGWYATEGIACRPMDPEPRWYIPEPPPLEGEG